MRPQKKRWLRDQPEYMKIKTIYDLSRVLSNLKIIGTQNEIYLEYSYELYKLNKQYEERVELDRSSDRLDHYRAVIDMWR